jgi:hypothetical protein
MATEQWYVGKNSYDFKTGKPKNAKDKAKVKEAN